MLEVFSLFTDSSSTETHRVRISFSHHFLSASSRHFSVHFFFFLSLFHSNVEYLIIDYAFIDDINFVRSMIVLYKANQPMKIPRIVMKLTGKPIYILRNRVNDNGYCLIRIPTYPSRYR